MSYKLSRSGFLDKCMSKFSGVTRIFSQGTENCQTGVHSQPPGGHVPQCPPQLVTPKSIFKILKNRQKFQNQIVKICCVLAHMPKPRVPSLVRIRETSSSAVAERPRDASCMSVVSFNSTILGAQFLSPVCLP